MRPKCNQQEGAAPMKRCLRICCLLAILILPTYHFGQIVCVPAGGCGGSCEDEKVVPNLTISRPVKLTGVLHDRSGAPIRFSGATIEVRDESGKKVLSSALLDAKGRFDLGKVPKGEFRLVAFRIRDNKVSRLPLFDQPKRQSCSGENDCYLEIVLDMHGTDEFLDFCPPK